MGDFDTLRIATVRIAARAPGRVVRALAIAFALGAGLLLMAAHAHADPIRIVAIGDSNFDPPGVDPDLTYPPKLEAALRAKGHDVVVINAGHRGDMTRDILRRMAHDVPDGTVITLVTIGVNDYFAKVPRETIGENMAEIVRRLRERKIEVLLFGLGDPHNPDCCFGARLAQKYDALFYRTYQDGLTDDPTLHIEKQKPAPGAEVMGYKSATAWHLNSAGNDIVVERTLPLVEELIARVKARHE